MAIKKRTTSKQKAASRRNLEKARAAKKRGGSKSIDNMSLGERKKHFKKKGFQTDMARYFGSPIAKSLSKKKIKRRKKRIVYLVRPPYAGSGSGGIW